jgi:hypothetical protein
MTTLTHSYWRPTAFLQVLSRRSVSRERRPDTGASPEESRARREFVQDMLTRNPDAFTSDLDVQSMMLCYPDRY